MPGVTPLGLHYPLQGETVDAASWQTLANDIDGLMTTTQTLRTAAFKPPTASIGNNGSLAVSTASGGSTIMLYNVVHWDNASLVNLGVNNDRITVTPGVWHVRFTTTLSSVTTVTYARALILDTAGTTWGFAQMDAVAVGQAGAITVNAYVVNFAATVGIQGLVSWVGTGGPGSWVGTGAELQVSRIRTIADV